MCAPNCKACELYEQETLGYRTEYAVVNDLDEWSNMGRTFSTLEDAENHLEWQWAVRRPAMEERAKKEQALADESEYPRTNEARYHWNQEKDRTYHVVQREVGAWRSV